ncbi:uncharacterized protein BX663DRAFT_483761 [Cokeromyces recurvatus]|uniref:uncharacterized protein n=1 Tax=Cokeromyces recurvatus TaxID=90255 RepID=UPI00221ED233|nr:uncharacterized protein BX663DRAFT_483761 [Cokeromyces recurvatus]KAI7906126.1 hypothetical protein BX663DRAFT_483761 [Cokeromyces recurvatus]
MSEEQVKNVRFQPTIRLTTTLTDMTVDDELVTTEKYLLDQHLIHNAHSNDQFRLQWEELNIYHSKSDNESSYEQLIKKGQKYGFHVVKQVKEKETTHFYLSQSNQMASIEVSKYLLAALVMQIPFITEEWIDNMTHTHDKGFDLHAFNNSQPIIVERYGPLQRSAVFGPDKRRKTLFRNLHFWFFDENQFKDKKYFIERAGGKASLHTFEEALESTIHPGILFVQVPYETEAWVPVEERFCLEQDATRCIIDFEIFFSIIYCSTNFMCNPSANLKDHISPDDPIYESLPTMYPTMPTSSLRPVKVEAMVSNSLADTLPINDNDLDIKIKEEPIPLELSLYHDNHLTIDEKHSLTLKSFIEEEDPTLNYSIHDDVGPNTLDDIELPSNMNDMSDFFNEMLPILNNPSKKKIQKDTENQRREEEEERQQLRQQEEKMKRQEDMMRQQQQEEEEMAKAEQRRKRERQVQERERERENEQVKRQRLEVELQHQEQEVSYLKKEEVHETYTEPIIQNDTLNNELSTDNNQGKFTKVVFASLVVKSRPPQRQLQLEQSTGINYKRFKKVRPLQSANITDVIRLTANHNDRVHDHRANQHQHTPIPAVRVQDTNELDPDIAIRPVIIRKRTIR